ncbi:MAG: TRAP transporter small permease [Oxalobacteraceae bacterium]|nr:TRAP transporter small permease [Oxalobacteraceae bacterium]
MSSTNPISQAIAPAARYATLAFGWVVLAYAVALSLEVLGRKLFNTSFKGIDELGGFVLAVSAAIGASYAMAQRSHTRVDVFLVLFPRPVQKVLNTLAMACFAFFATFAAWRGISVLMETLDFKSSAPNLEIALWIPQSASDRLIDSVVNQLVAVRSDTFIDRFDPRDPTALRGGSDEVRFLLWLEPMITRESAAALRTSPSALTIVFIHSHVVGLCALKSLHFLRIFRGNPTGFHVIPWYKTAIGAVLMHQTIIDDFKLKLANCSDNFAVARLLNKQLGNPFINELTNTFI